MEVPASRTPQISVVLPVHNGARTLQAALKSIALQHFKDLEILVVNDGSTDATAEVLAAFSDPRLRVLEQPQSGIVGALRAGVSAARAPFIARLDADDEWADPGKLDLQYQYLKQHPKCVIVGTLYTVAAPNSPQTIIRPPTEDDEIRRTILLHSTFAHPTVLFRKDVYESVGGYREACGKHVEDIDLWFRMGRKGSFHILPFVGLHYTISKGGISARHARLQSLNTFRVAFANLPYLRLYPSIPRALYKYAKRTLILYAAALLRRPS